MAGRHWRVVGNFHTVGEVIVFATAPNWQGALRKGALLLKGHPKMKGRRITVGAFTVQEIDELPVSVLAEQLPLTEASGEASAQPARREIQQVSQSLEAPLEVPVSPVSQGPDPEELE